MNDGIRRLGSTALLTRIVIGIFIGSSLLALAAQVATMTMFDPFESTPLAAFAVVAGVAGLVNSITLLASIVLVAIWVFQAHSNLQESGVGGLNYSPGWATASFFLPFINLWVPFASTRELYNRSNGEPEWLADESAGDVTGWYACNWAAMVIFVAIVGIFLVESIPGVFVVMPPFAVIGLFVLFTVFVLGSAFYLMQVVRKVTAAQTAMQHVGQSDVFA